jgi:hypothetical protein
VFLSIAALELGFGVLYCEGRFDNFIGSHKAMTYATPVTGAVIAASSWLSFARTVFPH